MFDAGDRVVWVKSDYRDTIDGMDEARGRVLADDDGPLTLVMWDGDDEPDEAVTDDLIHESEYDRHEADAAEQHSRHADYHVYEVPGSVIEMRRKPKQIASCEGDSLAFTLDTLRDEGQIDDDSRIGILYRPDAEQAGRWLVNPYARGR